MPWWSYTTKKGQLGLIKDVYSSQVSPDSNYALILVIYIVGNLTHRSLHNVVLQEHTYTQAESKMAATGYHHFLVTLDLLFQWTKFPTLFILWLIKYIWEIMECFYVF